jgi:predicted oxidoreductase
MSAACEKYGIKLASNQIEFNLARTISLKNGLLEEMSKRGIQCLACERNTCASQPESTS